MEAFCKDLDLVKHIRQTYFRAHAPVFHKEVTYNLADFFGEMAKMAGLMGPEIHPVKDQWQRKNELQMAKGSTKNLYYFWVVSPIKSPKIMGLKWIHSPEAPKHQVGLSLCPWCRKEGQNEGTTLNLLCTGHYCFRLACKRCLQHLKPVLTECSVICWVVSPCMFAMMRSQIDLSD